MLPRGGETCNRHRIPLHCFLSNPKIPFLALTNIRGARTQVALTRPGKRSPPSGVSVPDNALKWRLARSRRTPFTHPNPAAANVTTFARRGFRLRSAPQLTSSHSAGGTAPATTTSRMKLMTKLLLTLLQQADPASGSFAYITLIVIRLPVTGPVRHAHPLAFISRLCLELTNCI